MRFKGAVKKWGNSWVVTIPSDYIHNELMKEGDEYWFEYEEKKEGGSNGERVSSKD